MGIKFIKENFGVVPNLAQANAELEGSELKVYLSICKFANRTGGCFPSYEAITAFAHVSTNSAKKAVKKLTDLDFLEVTKRKRSNGSHASNYYQLLIKTDELSSGVSPTIPPSIAHDTPLTQPLELNTSKEVPQAAEKDLPVSELEDGADKKPAADDDASKVLTHYYKVIRMYRLVVTNNNHVHKWAKDLENSLGFDIAYLYLKRLQERDLRIERDTNEYVPQLSSPMEVSTKATKIIDYFKRTKKVATTTADAERERERLNVEKMKRIRGEK